MAVLALGCVLLVGCGSSGSKSGSGSSTTTPELTKAEFTQQADAICKRYDDALSTASKALGSNPSSARQGDFLLNQAVPNLKKQVDELRALHPPAADAATIKTMLDDLATGVDDLATAVKVNPTKALQQQPAGLAKASAAATAYGFKNCGQ
jgi:hypothetical protein